MAEEIDLRSIWKSSKEKTAVGKVNLNAGKKTKTTLYWIKFILWIEFWLSVVSVGPLSYYFWDDGQQGMTIFYVVITVIYLFYYQFLIRKIESFHYDGNVVESLRKVYGYLRFYLLHYKVVVWLSILAGVLIGIFAPENASALESFNSPRQWAVFIGFMIVAVGIIGGTIHFLIHLIYGRKINRLKKTIKELQSEA